MPRFAIVESGSRQYLVQENDLIHVEKLANSEKGQEVELSQILMVRSDDQLKVGNPFIAGAKVRCEVLDEERQPKVINYHYRRRKNSRRTKGHRQTLTLLKVKAIEV